MAETVGQHQEALYTTPQNNDDGDADVVRGHFNTARADHNSHDSDSGIHVQSSTLAARPAFGNTGRKWVTIDSGVGRFWYDTGSAWVEITGTTFAITNGQPGVHDAGDSGASIEISWNNGPVQKITLTASATITFTNVSAGSTYTLILVQGGAGSYSPTLTGWDFGDNPPSYSTAVGSKNVVSGLYDGSEYLAAVGVTGA